MIQYSDEQVTVFQSALFQTTSTVIQLDESIIIIDPNWLPHEIDEIREHVNGVRGGRDCYLIFTHGDYDHIIGYKAFPDAKTIGSAGLRDHPDKERKLKLIRDFDASYYITRNYPIEFPVLDIVIEEDGQQLALGSTTLTFYKAPGHTADGLFTVIDSVGVCVFAAGDYLSDFELPFIYHSAWDYEGTIRQAARILKEHPVTLLIPGHGQHTTSQSEMDRRVEIARSYLERLRQAVVDGDDMALDQLQEEHGFLSEFTAECHKENVRIIQNEFQAEGSHQS
ncbi:MBL fold metallo-hydrolase [Paenibacillus glucanolyticus]|uniref:MBL fold metallo-hydrolase n=1 Tax=Paenibacillus glucanolyticus TaxID=59843 RepID=UPI00128AEF18|nr:MBL fold metallo-hydrolase [Paenibacillus glucanolyticus]MPY16907.1 MBL fold metallo-hydrolase [Paenibacillus glucanolyticus]